MALNELNFEYKVKKPVTIEREWAHLGVVGSGDMEVLLEKKDYNGAVKVKVVTPVRGFEKVWNLVLEKFVHTHSLGDVLIEINDNNATPVVASMRLRQALNEGNKAVRGEE